MVKMFSRFVDKWKICLCNPSQANNLMENLFGSSIETKEEISINQIKVYVDRSTSHLQTYMEDYPTKNEMHSFILHTKSSIRKQITLFLEYLRKWKQC